MCIFKDNTPCRADMGGGVVIHGQMAPILTVAMKVRASFRRANASTKTVQNFLCVQSVASKVSWVESSERKGQEEKESCASTGR